jgi:hypothetical protein
LYAHLADIIIYVFVSVLIPVSFFLFPILPHVTMPPHYDPRLFLFSLCRASFKGEIGVDYGGVKRELFTLAIKEFMTQTDTFAPVADDRGMWFTDKAYRDNLVLARSSSLSSRAAATGGGAGGGPDSGPAATAAGENAGVSASESCVSLVSSLRDVVMTSDDASLDDRSLQYDSDVRKMPRLNPSEGEECVLSVPGSAVDSSTSGSSRDAAADALNKYQYGRPLPYYFGILVGLAVYNSVPIEIPLPSFIFKLIKDSSAEVQQMTSLLNTVL